MAVITVVPAPTIVTTPAAVTVATAGLLLVYVTAKPEEAVAVKLKLASPTVLAGSVANVIVWFVLAGAFTVNVCVTAGAAL